MKCLKYLKNTTVVLFSMFFIYLFYIRYYSSHFIKFKRLHIFSKYKNYQDFFFKFNDTPGFFFKFFQFMKWLLLEKKIELLCFFLCAHYNLSCVFLKMWVYPGFSSVVVTNVYLIYKNRLRTNIIKLSKNMVDILISNVNKL